MLETRHYHGTIHRRRQCQIAACGRTFTTVEVVAMTTARRPTVVQQMHAALIRLSRVLDALADGVAPNDAVHRGLDVLTGRPRRH